MLFKVIYLFFVCFFRANSLENGNLLLSIYSISDEVQGVKGVPQKKIVF